MKCERCHGVTTRECLYDFLETMGRSMWADGMGLAMRHVRQRSRLGRRTKQAKHGYSGHRCFVTSMVIVT